MASNLDIDQTLLKQVVRCGKFKSKKTAVNEALREYLARRQQASLLKMFGKVDIDPTYNYKKHRA